MGEVCVCLKGSGVSLCLEFSNKKVYILKKIFINKGNNSLLYLIILSAASIFKWAVPYTNCCVNTRISLHCSC